MNVTCEVINDLLPAYLCGEASPDSRSLVEEFLKNDPELARLIEQLKKVDSQKTDLLKGAGMNLSPDHDLRTLARTRAMLERRSWLFALALVFSLVPLSFTFDNSHITWIMLRDVPRMASLYWALAIGFWIALWFTNRRLRTSGL